MEARDPNYGTSYVAEERVGIETGIDVLSFRGYCKA